MVPLWTPLVLTARMLRETATADLDGKVELILQLLWLHLEFLVGSQAW